MSTKTKGFWRLVCAIMLVVVFAGVAQAQTLRINVYSQRDARWANEKMSPSRLTVGNYGCLMTCLAATYRQSPATLNSYLSRYGGYTSGGLLIHTVAARFDGARGMQYAGTGRLPSNAQSVGRGIRRRAVYIVRSLRPLGATHWVLVYKATSGQAYYMDPWDGTTRRVGDGWVSYGAEARIYRF